MRLAFLASGGGSNFQAILNRIADGSLPGFESACLITNNSQCGAVQKAIDASVPVYHLSAKTHPDPDVLAHEMLERLLGTRAEFIVLAGYMKKVPDSVLREYNGRVVNIHPALLPSFGGQGLFGHHVHNAVLAAGAKVTGVTVHLVDSVYDHGRILAQRVVPVYATDSADDVARRVLVQEHDIYWRVLKCLANEGEGLDGLARF